LDYETLESLRTILRPILNALGSRKWMLIGLILIDIECWTIGPKSLIKD